jgi:hypothetical protein
MEEDQAIAGQREQLKRESEKLRKALESINALEFGSGGIGGSIDVDGLLSGVGASAGASAVDLEDAMDEA